MSAQNVSPPSASSTKDLLEAHQASDDIAYLSNLKGFHLNWMIFLVVMPCLYLLNQYLTPHEQWYLWAAGGWGLGIILHALTLYGLFFLFGRNWEKEQLQKRHGRKIG